MSLYELEMSAHFNLQSPLEVLSVSRLLLIQKESTKGADAVRKLQH